MCDVLKGLCLTVEERLAALAEVTPMSYEDENLRGELSAGFSNLNDISRELEMTRKEAAKRKRCETYVVTTHPLKVECPEGAEFEQEEEKNLATTLSWFTRRGGEIVQVAGNQLLVTLPVEKKRKQ